MLTPDKDYGQLISKNVYMFRPKHGGGYETIGEQEIEEKYGIDSPHKVIDLLALMGDSADNFPGCPGVGEKTAVKLINQFGSVDNLLNRTDELKGKMKEKVEAAIDDIKMSKFLATIRTDVPIDISIEELRIEEPDKKKLAEIFENLEFRTLAKKILNNSETITKKQNSQLDLFAEFPTERKDEEKKGHFLMVKTVNQNINSLIQRIKWWNSFDFLGQKKFSV